jgi:long-chain acyl-CoA synthetase
LAWTRFENLVRQANPFFGGSNIEKERITVFIGPATLDWELMEAPSFGETDLTSVTGVGGGGSPRAAANVLRIDKLFPNAVPNIGWGMTETNAIGTYIGETIM